jgi:hypothetical protein
MVTTGGKTFRRACWHVFRAQGGPSLAKKSVLPLPRFRIAVGQRGSLVAQHGQTEQGLLPPWADAFVRTNAEESRPAPLAIKRLGEANGIR